MKELISQEIRKGEKKYKYYKLSRSKSNTILKETPFDVYVTSKMDKDGSTYISDDNYSYEYKYSKNPLVFSDRYFKSCKNIETINDIVNGIIENIKAYTKDNKFIHIIIYKNENNRLCVTTYTVKKVIIIETIKNQGTDDEEKTIDIYNINNPEEKINKTNQDYQEDPEESDDQEDQEIQITTSKYFGYAIIENEEIEEIKQVKQFARSLGDINLPGTILYTIANYIAMGFVSYENNVINKFSIIFATEDEYSYFDSNDALINKIDKTYTNLQI